MPSIHPKVQDFGDVDERKYESGKINKENINEFCIFFLLIRNRNTQTYNKIRQENLVQVLSKEEGIEGSERRTFFHCKTFVKEKNGVAYKPSTFSVQTLNEAFSGTPKQRVQR